MLQKADLAIADLTITYEREQAVDFTMPFMNLGKKLIFFSVNILWPLFFCNIVIYIGIYISICTNKYTLIKPNQSSTSINKCSFF